MLGQPTEVAISQKSATIWLNRYNTPRLSGYFACSVLTNNSNADMPRRFCKHGSFMKNGQHAKPVATLRSSHSSAGWHRPLSARVHAI